MAFKYFAKVQINSTISSIIYYR